MTKRGPLNQEDRRDANLGRCHPLGRTLVVMEPGSQWPGHVGYHVNLVAFCPNCDELPRGTEEALNALRGAEESVRVAVLACNGETDGAEPNPRTQIAFRLLAAVTTATFGRLVLSASDGASLPLREELFALADALSAKLRGTTATVSLKFGDLGPRNSTRAWTTGSRFDSSRFESPSEPRVKVSG
jgi:hypothetical protein